jgi:hypothetical protein
VYSPIHKPTTFELSIHGRRQSLTVCNRSSKRRNKSRPINNERSYPHLSVISGKFLDVWCYKDIASSRRKGTGPEDIHVCRQTGTTTSYPSYFIGSRVDCVRWRESRRRDKGFRLVICSIWIVIVFHLVWPSLQGVDIGDLSVSLISVSVLR